MSVLVFDTKLTENGMLFCPKEYSFKNAINNVIVKIDDEESIDIENSAIMDNSSDFLTEEEVNYYINLD
jgi:hypothetical protein